MTVNVTPSDSGTGRPAAAAQNVTARADGSHAANDQPPREAPVVEGFRRKWNAEALKTLGLLALTCLVLGLTMLAMQGGDEAGTSPSVVMPSGGDRRGTSDATPSPAGEGDTAPTPIEGNESLRLERSSYVGNPFETILIRGTYVGAPADTTLRVQRREDDRWVDFPLPAATDETGRFSAYVELGSPGRYRLRIADPEGGATSDVVVLRIG